MRNLLIIIYPLLLDKSYNTFKLINAFMRNLLRIIYPLLMNKSYKSYNLQFLEQFFMLMMTLTLFELGYDLSYFNLHKLETLAAHTATNLICNWIILIIRNMCHF